MELNQALVKMEQGGSADGILQVSSSSSICTPLPPSQMRRKHFMINIFLAPGSC